MIKYVFGLFSAGSFLCSSKERNQGSLTKHQTG